MNKILIIIILVTIDYFNLYSQDTSKSYIYWDSTENHIIFPTREQERKLRSELKYYDLAIDLYVHPKAILDKEQSTLYNQLLDTIETLKDSEIIFRNEMKLKSGVSWELDGDPPPVPDYFYFKLLTKRGRNDKSVTERLKYLQFYYYWDKNNAIPYDMIDKINRYYSILISNEKLYEYSFDFIIDENLKIKKINSMIKFYNQDKALTLTRVKKHCADSAKFE